MNTSITYLIATVVSLGIFYGIYGLILRREPLFRFNRFYLLSGLLLSYLIPLIIFLPNTFVPSIVKVVNDGIIGTINLSPVEISATASNYPSLLSLLGYLYLSGTVFFAARLVIRVIGIYRLGNNGERSDQNDLRILWSKADFPPFSFFRTMYLPLNLKDKLHLNEIIRHEQIHIESHHSFDIVLTQLMQVLFWFNPFILLIENALREIHEFEADKAVIHSGTDPVAYTRILFSQDKSAQAVLLGNNFNYSLIKRRLTMFYKKNTRYARVKAILALPLAASILIIIAIGCQQTTQPIAPPPPPPPPPPTEIVAQGDEVFTVVEKMPEYPGGDDARVKYMAHNLLYPESAIKNKTEGTVYISFIVEKNGAVTDVTLLKGIGGECDTEAVRIIKNMPHWIPGTQRGEPVRVKFTIPVKFKLSDNEKSGIIGYERRK